MLFSRTTAAFYGLATLANAHMLMRTPQPFDTPRLSNGPLDASGSDFPCKVQNGQQLIAGSASNTFALGSSQPLLFRGSAVHGGGSCQISITYDQQPTKNSVWKVIHSIEGGCPAKGQAGNMGDNADALAPDTYNFTVPADIPTGDVVLAWTWFNKIGNREMYMNCAPVTLTGNAGDKSSYDKLPDMFVANVNNGCSTPDSKDLEFPSPGQNVERLNGATNAFAPPVETACRSGSRPTSGSGSGASPPPAVTSVPAVGGNKPTKTGLPGGVFITAAPSSDAGAAQPPATSAPASQPISPPNSGSGSGSAGAQTAGSACSPEGTWLCLGASYQQCASGTWSVAMSLAAGTSCTPGQGGSINIVATNGRKKRVAVRFRG